MQKEHIELLKRLQKELMNTPTYFPYDIVVQNVMDAEMLGEIIEYIEDEIEADRLPFE